MASIFFDVKKAFDSVPHDKLIQSLAHISVCGPLLQWLTDYLQNRHQRVVLDGESSSLVSVSSGVRQGSILGPLLFIIFMNSITDLPLSSGAKLILYGDDILLYKAIDSPNDVLLLQQDVNLILQWFRDHGLTPNHSKTKLLQVTRSKTAPEVPISIDDYPLSPSNTVKYLGVTLSSNLSWSDHINSVCKTAKRHLGLVHRKLHQASPRVRHAIYCSTILPKLDYCCAVWDPHYSTDKTALNRVQRFASRVITHKWHANHSTLLNSLNWQPLEIRRRLIKLKVCYNVYSCIPSSVFTPHPYSGLHHFHDRMLLRPNAKTYSHRLSFLLILILYPFGILGN